MPEIEVKEKYLDKIKEEIKEFESIKLNLVKNINNQLLKAKTDADKIITDAKSTVKEILDGAGKIKDEAIEYSNKSKQTADNYLNESREKSKEAEKRLLKLVEEKEMLNILTITHNNSVKAAGEKFDKIEKDLNERQACLDSKEITIRTLENQHNKKRIAQQKAEEIRLIKEAEIIAKQKELNSKIENYLKDEEAINNQKELNEQFLIKIKAAQDEIIVNKKINEDLAIEIKKQNEELETKHKTLLEQFNLLDKNQRELEEKEKSLNEREQLVAIKDKDVTDKIKILQELRLKK